MKKQYIYIQKRIISVYSIGAAVVQWKPTTENVLHAWKMKKMLSEFPRWKYSVIFQNELDFPFSTSFCIVHFFTPIHKTVWIQCGRTSFVRAFKRDDIVSFQISSVSLPNQINNLLAMSFWYSIWKSKYHDRLYSILIVPQSSAQPSRYMCVRVFFLYAFTEYAM